MKASFFTICLVAVGLLAEAQTAKPKTTATGTKPTATTTQKKPVATAAKKPTTAAKPKTTATAAKKPAPKPAVATAPKATTTAVASTTTAAVAEAEPVVEQQQTVTETKPVAEVTEKETSKSSKRSKTEKVAKAPKPEKPARAEKPAKPEKPAKVKTESAYSGRGLSIGIRGGANLWMNEFMPEELSGAEGEQEAAPGFTGGVIINYGIGEVFSIQPEILYTRRSVKVAGEESGQKYSFQVSTNAVEIPLLLKLSFGRKTRFFVNAGPYVAYGLDASAKFVVDGETLLNEKQKLTSDDDRLEYGVTGGLGVSIPAGPGRLLVEGRYHYSLGTDANPKPTDYVSMQVATFSVGYLFPLGRR